MKSDNNNNAKEYEILAVKKKIICNAILMQKKTDFLKIINYNSWQCGKL